MTSLSASRLVGACFLVLTSVGAHRSVKFKLISIGFTIQTKDLAFGLISLQLHRDLGVQLGGNILQNGLIFGAPFSQIEAGSGVHFPRLSGISVFSNLDTQSSMYCAFLIAFRFMAINIRIVIMDEMCDV